MLGPDVLGPDVLGPDVLGPDVLGPDVRLGQQGGVPDFKPAHGGVGRGPEHVGPGTAP